jgi:hypothetical protein
VMDYEDREDLEEGLPKWPFFFSALFIFAGAIGFAYFHFHTAGVLEVWQILVCILSSGMACLLIFMPFLLERSLQLCLETANRKDDELFRKVYFDLKEVRNDLESLAVKIDKVPTLVDKIVSDSVKDSNSAEEIANELHKMQDDIALKLGRIEELASPEPPIKEPEPELIETKKSVAELEKTITSLSSQADEIINLIKDLPTEFPEPQIQVLSPPREPQEEESKKKTPTSDPKKITEESEEKPEEIEISGILHEDAFSPDAEVQEIMEENQALSDDQEQETNDDELKMEEEDLEPSPVAVEDDLEESEEDPINLLEEEIIDPPEQHENLNIESELEQTAELSEAPKSDELDLGLPDPEETIRKVDALLSGKPTEETKAKPVKDKSTNSGMTSVVANVMIGIGNKPFVRGEGPGLSWDEGVAMNFIEIGKWAWSPTRKNASLTIQIYRNDEDPDKGGKYEIKPGEKFEVTPEF